MQTDTPGFYVVIMDEHNTEVRSGELSDTIEEEFVEEILGKNKTDIFLEASKGKVVSLPIIDRVWHTDLNDNASDSEYIPNNVVGGRFRMSWKEYLGGVRELDKNIISG